jgi:serine/threonine protein kinase
MLGMMDIATTQSEISMSLKRKPTQTVDSSANEQSVYNVDASVHNHDHKRQKYAQKGNYRINNNNVNNKQYHGQVVTPESNASTGSNSLYSSTSSSSISNNSTGISTGASSGLPVDQLRKSPYFAGSTVIKHPQAVDIFYQPIPLPRVLGKGTYGRVSYHSVPSLQDNYVVKEMPRIDPDSGGRYLSRAAVPPAMPAPAPPIIMPAQQRVMVPGVGGTEAVVESGSKPQNHNNNNVNNNNNNANNNNNNGNNVRYLVGLGCEFNSVALRETNILSRLQHPNLSVCLSASLTDKSIKCVLPYAGTTLENWIRYDAMMQYNQRMTQAPFIIYQVLQANKYLHWIGVIHNDLKPGNIMINPKTFKITIVDLGAAILDNLLCSQSLCTYSYRAPELFPMPGEEQEIRKTGAAVRYHSIQATPASEVFSMGIIFLELITGQVPFVQLGGEKNRPHNYIQELAVNGQLDFLPIPDEVQTKFFTGTSDTKSFLDLIRQMLSFNPAKRPSIDVILQHRLFNTSRGRWSQHIASYRDEFSAPVLPKHLLNSFHSEMMFQLNPLYLQELDDSRSELLNSSIRSHVWESVFDFCIAMKSLPIYSLAVYLFDQYFSLSTPTKKHQVDQVAYVCLALANDIVDYNVISLRRVYTHMRNVATKSSGNNNISKHQSDVLDKSGGGNATSIATTTIDKQPLPQQPLGKAVPTVASSSSSSSSLSVPSITTTTPTTTSGTFPSLPQLQQHYGDIVQKLRFRIYTRMFDHLILHQRVRSRSEMQYTVTGKIDYHLVKSICLTVPLFLTHTQSQLSQYYLSFEDSRNKAASPPQHTFPVK